MCVHLCVFTVERREERVLHMNLEQRGFDPRYCDVSCLTWAVGPCFARQLNLDFREAGKGKSSQEEYKGSVAF